MSTSQPGSKRPRSTRRTVVSVVMGLLASGGAATLWSFAPSPLPAPTPWQGPLPAATPPATMTIHRLPTGTYETPAFLAFRGGSFSEKRSFVATAVLIRHPKGDLLLDSGFGSNVERHLALLPAFQRGPHHLDQPVRSWLTTAGYDPSALRGVVITHSHWDHTSGLADLPAPVWMNDGELGYVGVERDDTRVFRSLEGLKIERYVFDGPAYLGFSASHDVWGDGSVVLVPSPGHTPGSIIAFVALPTGERYAFIGDLTWQLEGLTERAERPWLLRLLADHDPPRVREDLLRMVSLSGLMQIVPAHDGRAFERIPLLR